MLLQVRGEQPSKYGTICVVQSNDKDYFFKLIGRTNDNGEYEILPILNQLPLELFKPNRLYNFDTFDKKVLVINDKVFIVPEEHKLDMRYISINNDYNDYVEYDEELNSIKMENMKRLENYVLFTNKKLTDDYKYEIYEENDKYVEIRTVETKSIKLPVLLFK